MCKQPFKKKLARQEKLTVKYANLFQFYLEAYFLAILAQLFTFYNKIQQENLRLTFTPLIFICNR